MNYKLNTLFQKFCDKNGILNTESSYNEFIEYLMSDLKDQTALGGLVALRGFKYQLYLTVYYAVKMVSSSNSPWFTSIVIELWEDLTLIGDDKCRLIQVKTKDVNDSVTVGDVSSRGSRNRADSWLDKLYESGVRWKADDFEVEYELAINSFFSDKLKTYYENRDFEIDNIPDDDKVLINLLKKVKADESTGVEINPYEKSEVMRYLQKLRLKSYRELGVLKNDICDELVKANICNTKLVSYIAPRVVERCFEYLISLCSDEDLDEKIIDLTLTFEDMKSRFQNWIQEEANILFIKAKEDSLKGKYQEVILRLSNRLRQKWEDVYYIEVNSLLTEFNEKVDKLEEEDPFIRAKILNRIFFLEDTENIDYDGYITRLDDILELIISTVVMFTKKEFVIDNGKFIFSVGTSNEKHVITNYDVNNMKCYSEAREYVMNHAMCCDKSKQFNHNYLCVLENLKETVDVSAGLRKLGIKIVQPNTQEQVKITEFDVNISFVNAKKIKAFVNSINQEQNSLIKSGVSLSDLTESLLESLSEGM